MSLKWWLSIWENKLVWNNVEYSQSLQPQEKPPMSLEDLTIFAFICEAWSKIK